MKSGVLILKVLQYFDNKMVPPDQKMSLNKLKCNFRIPCFRGDLISLEPYNLIIFLGYSIPAIYMYLVMWGSLE